MLGLNLFDIIQHILLLLILVFFMKYLMYNPVVKFINKRKETVEQTVKENERLSAEVKEIKENSDKIVEEARKKAETISFEATKEAEARSKEILAEAKKKSDDMIERSKKRNRKPEGKTSGRSQRGSRQSCHRHRVESAGKGSFRRRQQEGYRRMLERLG